MVLLGTAAPQLPTVMRQAMASLLIGRARVWIAVIRSLIFGTESWSTGSGISRWESIAGSQRRCLVVGRTTAISPIRPAHTGLHTREQMKSWLRLLISL